MFGVVHGSGPGSGLKLCKREDEAAVAKFPLGEAQAGGEGDAALEAAVGNLQSQYIGAPPLAGQGAGAGDDQRLAFDLDAHRFGRDAGQRGDDPKLALGLEHVDRRLPAGGTHALARRLEELAVKLLGLLEQGAGLGPHLMFRITHYAVSSRPL